MFSIIGRWPVGHEDTIACALLGLIAIDVRAHSMVSLPTQPFGHSVTNPTIRPPAINPAIYSYMYK